jgi:RluA family pseudouridine synthase
MEPDGFELLYEEGPCLVVSKPGGVLTQAAPGIDSLEIRIKQFLKERDSKSGKVYLGVPHRLDRPVSGAMIFGKHQRAARRLCEQFEGRTIEKTYWALVEGEVAPDAGTWQDQILKVPNEARGEIVEPSDPAGRSAVLHYRVIERLAAATWLEIRLETGRYHQIRVQAASRGHPVIGDSQYGSTRPFGPQTQDPRARWIALHSRSLNFRHPMTRERTYISASLPSAWLDFGIAEPPSEDSQS